MLEEVGLAHRLAHYPAQMSGGERSARRWRARLSPIRRFCLPMSRPAIWIKTRTPDYGFDLRLAEERGTTVLLITHDRVLADRCARVETMQDGFYRLR